MPPRRLASGRGPNGSQLPRCGSICARLSADEESRQPLVLVPRLHRVSARPRLMKTARRSQVAFSRLETQAPP